MTVQSIFIFTARDAAGTLVNGQMTAGSADEVGTRLRAEGKYVVAVQENSMRVEAALDERQIRRNEAAKRVRREDVIAFCQQLSVMLETGVPLSEALDSFMHQTQRREFKQVVASLRDDIHGGEQFSVAMAKWPRVFPTMIVSLMKASEASGTMSMMLGRVAEYLNKERRTARQVKGALGYPMFMMGTAVLMTVFLMTFVLPRFAKIYEMRSAQLPAPTRVLLGISQFFTEQYMFYLPALATLIIGGYFWFRLPSGRRVVDWLRLNAPILRTIYGQLYISRSNTASRTRRQISPRRSRCRASRPQS
jgi:type II secretory pathway component PulF